MLRPSSQNPKKVFANNKNPALDSVALNGIDLVVPKGGLVSLVGPDGAGKTTFMRLVCGLLIPTSGKLEVFGMNTATDAEAIQNGSLTCLSVLDCIKT